MAQMKKFLDIPMPDIIEQWRYYLSLLRPESGHRVIDVGSGSGDAVYLLSQDFPAIEKVVGIDSNRDYCERATKFLETARYPNNVEIKVADALNLPFPDNYFDRAICAEMLEYVPDPTRAISEVFRILKPDGIALFVHSDFDTQVFNAGDRDRTRRIVKAFSDAGPNGWMGRELYGLCKGGGFSSVTPFIYPFLSISWGRTTYPYKMSHMMVEWLSQKFMIPDNDLTQWISDIEQAYIEGNFVYSINRYSCRCTK